MLGFLNIYKPSGITSNAVVQKIKKKFHIDKIGHMGTLDPLACGILPIAVGKATRLFDYSLDKKKRYTAIFDFGYSTDTLDIEGVKEKECGVIPTIEQIKSAMHKLIGEIDQIPPKYSAKCIDGKRGYQLARKGVEFELAPKKVTVLSAECLRQTDEDEFEFTMPLLVGENPDNIITELYENNTTQGIERPLQPRGDRNRLTEYPKGDLGRK